MIDNISDLAYEISRALYDKQLLDFSGQVDAEIIIEEFLQDNVIIKEDE